MHDKIFAEIGILGLELEELNNSILDDTLVVGDLENSYERVSKLFDDIRTYGVSRGDIQKLNQLGFAEIEEVFYTEKRSLVGLTAALESERDWMTVVIGGLMATLAVVLAYFVGKLLGWLFGASDKLSSSGSASDKATAAKTKNIPDVLIKFGSEGIGDATGYADVIALASIKSQDFRNGTVVRGLMSDIDELLAVINTNVESFVTTDAGYLPYLKASDRKAEYEAYCEALQTGKDISSKQDDLVNAINTIPEVVTCGRNTFTTLYPLCKSVLSVESSAKLSEKLSAIQKLSNQNFFDKDLVSQKYLNLDMNLSMVDVDSLRAEHKVLSGKVKTFEAFADTKAYMRDNNNFTGTVWENIFDISSASKSAKKSYTYVLKHIVKIHIGYPTQLAIKVINVCINKLLKAMIKYKQLQVQVRRDGYKFLYITELDKVKAKLKKSLVNSPDLLKELNDEIDSIYGQEPAEALVTLQGVYKRISKEAQDSAGIELADVPVFEMLEEVTEKGSKTLTKEDICSAILAIKPAK